MKNFDAIVDKVTAYIKPSEAGAFLELVAMTTAYKVPDRKIELILAAASDIDGLRNRFKACDEVTNNEALVRSKPLGPDNEIFFFYRGRCVASLVPCGVAYNIRLRGGLPWEDDIAVSTIDGAVAYLHRRWDIPRQKESVAVGREVVYDFEET